MDLENLKISIDLKNNPDIRKVAESVGNNCTDSQTLEDKVNNPYLNEASKETSGDTRGTLQHITENKISPKLQRTSEPPKVNKSYFQASPPSKPEGSLPQVKFVNEVPKFELLSGRNLNLSFDKFTEVTVLQVEDPTHIIIRPVQWEQEFQLLTNQLKDSYDGQNINLKDDMDRIKEMVLAASGERIKVIEFKSETRLKVEYIDSGLTGFVKTTDVFDISEKVQAIPPLCARVVLAGIKIPSDKSKCAKAKAILSQIICQRYFVKKAKSSDNNVINVVLAADASGGGDIAKRLLDKNLVEKDLEKELFVPVEIVKLIDPDNFYLKTFKDTEEHLNLQVLCEKYSFIPITSFTPRLNMVLMHHHEGRFQRVMVVNVQSYSQMTVEFLDIGGRKSVPTSSLGCIPKNSPLLSTPPTCKLARLTGICPLNGSTWDEEAVDNFRLILGILEDDPVPLFAKVVNGPPSSIHETWHSVMEVQLSTEPDGSVILADGMIDMGFAKKLERDLTGGRCFLNTFKPATPPKSGDRVLLADCDPSKINILHMQYEKEHALLLKLQAELFNLLNEGALQTMEALHLLVGEVVIARRELDRNVYRAVVETIQTTGEVLVRFLDFGNTEWISRNDLFLLPPVARQCKVLSHTVELAEVPPCETVTPEQKRVIAQVFSHFSLFEYTQVFGGAVSKVYIKSVPQAINQRPVDVNEFFARVVGDQNNESFFFDFKGSKNFPGRESRDVQAKTKLVPKSFKSKKSLSWTCSITHIDPSDRGVFYFVMFEDLDKIGKMFDQFPAACVHCPDFKASEGTRCLWRDPGSDLEFRVAVIKEHSSEVMAVRKIDFGDTVEKARRVDLFEMPTKMKIALDAPLVRKGSLQRFNMFDDGDKQDIFADYDEDMKHALLECLQEEYLFEEIELKVIDHDGDKYNVEIMLRGAASG